MVASVVLIGGCSKTGTDESGELDLLDVVHRNLPGVNILPGATADSVYMQLSTGSPPIAALGRLSKELGLPAELYTSMTSSAAGGLVPHTTMSECCVATWILSSDDGYMLDLHLRGSTATLTTELVQPPTPT